MTGFVEYSIVPILFHAFEHCLVAWENVLRKCTHLKYLELKRHDVDLLFAHVSREIFKHWKNDKAKH